MSGVGSPLSPHGVRTYVVFLISLVSFHAFCERTDQLRLHYPILLLIRLHCAKPVLAETASLTLLISKPAIEYNPELVSFTSHLQNISPTPSVYVSTALC
jgi:hypothetical protein